jgi:cytochrome c biogenesis protein CcmG/thiol:disulfide interchange protein DsbE
MMSPAADDALRIRRHRRISFAALAVLAGFLAGNAVAGVPPLDLERYRGKVVVLDFWASWCKPCRQSIPWLNEMKSRYARDGLVVIGVNVDAEHADAERFMRAVPIDFDVVFDPDGELAKRYDLHGMPSSFLIGRDGKLIESRVGFKDAQKDEHEAELKRLLSDHAH